MGEETSLGAYLSMKPEDREALRKRLAMVMLTVGTPMSARQLHERTGLDLQSVTPRLAEMRSLGIVQHAGRLKNSTGKTVKAHTLTDKGREYAEGKWEPVGEPEKAPSRMLVGRVIQAARRVAAADPVKDPAEWVAAHQENKAAVAALDGIPKEQRA